MTTPPNPSTLYSSLAKISPQDYSSLPRSPPELTSFLTSTIEAAELAVSSIPAHPSAPNSSHEDREIEKLYKPIKLPSTPPPPGDMKLWKLSAKDGKGTWFARRSVHENIGFERFKRGLDAEFSLGENGIQGVERQEVPGGGVDSVRGIGCVERIGEKIVEDSGEGAMEIFRLAAQFPGPTAAREFVTVCCKKQWREKGGGRWYMIVSRPVKAGGEVESVCPSKEGKGYIRGEYESLELIREVISDGEGDELVEESEVPEYTVDEGEHVGGDDEAIEMVEEGALDGGQGKGKQTRHRRMHRKQHRHHQEREDDPVDLLETLLVPENTSPSNPTTPESIPNSTSDSDDRVHPIEWVMLSRSDPGGNVPRWLVERGTPGSVMKDAEKFLNWLVGLSDEQLGFRRPQSSGETVDREYEIAVTPNEDVVKEEGVQEIPIQEEDAQQDSELENEGLIGSAFGIASNMVSSIAPTSILPNMSNILGRGTGSNTDNTNVPSNVTPPQRPSPPVRVSTDAASLQSFSTAAQHPIEPDSPPPTPSGFVDTSLTPSTTSSTVSATTIPPPTDNTESKPLSRLLSQKARLRARLEKALQKNRKGEEAEKKLKQRYEEEVKHEEERYKRDLEKLVRRKEREAQKQKEKEQKEREKEEREKEKKVREKRVSNASQTVKEVREVVERLTRENEKLVRENEELRRRMSVLEAEIGRN